MLLFAISSGVAGGVHNSAMLIAGGKVHGIGAGDIDVLIDMICCDLVPLREGCKYLSYTFSFAGFLPQLLEVPSFSETGGRHSPESHGPRCCYGSNSSMP